MTTLLQKKIRTYLGHEHLSIAAFERKAGLKINVVRNILAGQSKRPTGVTLSAIARVLGCSLGTLLGEEGQALQTPQPLLFPDLLREIFEKTLEILQKKSSHITTKDLFRLLDEMYAYGIKKDPPSIDNDFIEWFIERTLKEERLSMDDF